MEKENLNIEKRLENLKDQKIFKVPDHYFDNFSGRLKERIASESKSTVSQSWINVFLRPALGIAAVFAVLFLAIYVPLKESSKDGNTAVSYNEPPVNTNNGNERGDIDALMMMSQSQFLSALEAVETSEGDEAIDPQQLKDYLAENSLDYYLLTSN